MRLGVLDVGSNTVHLLVVDARRGGHPTPQLSEKEPLKLAGHLDADGAITEYGVSELVRIVGQAALSAARLGCDELLAFATSALRDATNSAEVLHEVRALTGVDLQVLSGPDEARVTFLAARRWFGYSAGDMVVLDIGGGSLELAGGQDEEPAVALSLPLGAGRLRRDLKLSDPPTLKQLSAAEEFLVAQLAGPAKKIRSAGPFNRAVGTSKTFRTLARLAGAAPSSAGPLVPRTLSARALRQITAFVTRMAASDIGALDGVSANRAEQTAVAALVAEAAVTALKITELHICPWALREGLILRRLDQLAFADSDPDSESGTEAGSESGTDAGSRARARKSSGAGRGKA